MRWMLFWRHEAPRIHLTRGQSIVGNATSLIEFEGEIYSLMPVGPHRVRTSADVEQLHRNMIDYIGKHKVSETTS